MRFLGQLQWKLGFWTDLEGSGRFGVMPVILYSSSVSPHSPLPQPPLSACRPNHLHAASNFTPHFTSHYFQLNHPMAATSSPADLPDLARPQPQQIPRTRSSEEEGLELVDSPAGHRAPPTAPKAGGDVTLPTVQSSSAGTSPQEGRATLESEGEKDILEKVIVICLPRS